MVEADDVGDLLADPGAAFVHIRGLYLPNPGGAGHLCTGPAEVPTKFDTSPYIAQRAYYEKILAECDSQAVAVWETNRGCPYSCAYCDRARPPCRSCASSARGVCLPRSSGSAR